MNISSVCIVCNGQKMVTIHQTMNIGGVDTLHTQDIPVYDLVSWECDPNVSVEYVFCSECGILYHRNSIQG